MSQRIVQTYRFGNFELDGDAFALRRLGEPVRLERRPLELLFLLAERGGRLATRDEIAARLWGANFHVEIDMGVNTAIGKLRKALGAEAASVETVAGRGYRLGCPIEVAHASDAACMIAVLPFETLAPSGEHDYLADGFTEETIALLGEIEPGHLFVIGRTSVMAYRGTGKTLKEIATELAADYLVESSMRIGGERLRITSRLIRASDQSQMWSASYDGDTSSLLDLQLVLAGAIAEQVRQRLAPPAARVTPVRQTSNTEAYDLYLRGRAFWNRATGPSGQKAIEFFSRATAIDPQYSLAWAGLANAYAGGPIMSDLPSRTVWKLARDAASRSVGCGPDLAEAQAAHGFVKFWLDWDWEDADIAFARSVGSNPSFAFAHRMVGIAASHQGRHKQARDAIRRARELDPLYAMHHALSAVVELHARNYEAAEQFARHATIIDPDFWIGHYQLGQAFVHLGRADDAFECLSRAGALAGGNSKTIALQGYLLGQLGRTEDARARVETLLAISRERYIPPYAIALVHAGLGDAEAALDWLERAHDAHDVHLLFLPVDAKWDFLRADQRFDEIMRRCGTGPAGVGRKPGLLGPGRVEGQAPLR